MLPLALYSQISSVNAVNQTFLLLPWYHGLWKNGWRVKQGGGDVIFNPNSMFRGHNKQLFGTSVVLWGCHASLTWGKGNKITSGLVSPCVRAAASAHFRLALCAVKGVIVEAGCSGTGEQCCYTCSWKKSFAQFYEGCICPVGWFYQRLTATVECDLNDWWATKLAGCLVRVISQLNALQVNADSTFYTFLFFIFPPKKKSNFYRWHWAVIAAVSVELSLHTFTWQG